MNISIDIATAIVATVAVLVTGFLGALLIAMKNRPFNDREEGTGRYLPSEGSNYFYSCRTEPSIIPSNEISPPAPEREACSSLKGTGLIGKFIVMHSDGHPVDPEAEYFVLRLDEHPDTDDAHFKACRRAIQVYANEIKEEYPKLAQDLMDKYGEIRNDR